MGNFLIRNIPDDVLEKLKKRAQKNKRSLQKEILDILIKSSEDTPQEVIERIIRNSKKWEKQKRQFSDSVRLLREDRER
ncbi:MAG: Arc family DNA-binding protein [Calditrichaeota bacterium]|nr:Arc family DNA-binding protein [Calditrichota bacterium]